MNRKISLVLAAIALIYLILTFNLPNYEYILIDADVFPFLLGGALLVLSIVLFFLKSDEDATLFMKKKDLAVLLTMFSMLLAYILLLEPIGFVLSTCVFLFSSSLFLGYRKHLTNVAVSGVVPLTIYFLFTSLLGIALPQGILPF
ncbi:tripartite tricarboxylate transporter TctB family protein [Shouchella sp. JSM 1781072]|uniref:tripartite tricarboxylate transporter TctB family protein n=1 Tax=Bacillaceae TaxID=186817 RepID=UPI0020D14C06|nr:MULTISPECIES: tripartite tricarboxylate transporter TctB family protein [Bacillaceae]UTR07278.1 tripartite tricarboxylate transporter TctB family protein [Alkalihalobacillus sp. LMS6]